MARMLDVAAGVLVLASAAALYVVKYDARRLEADVNRREQAIERAQSDIAILKAERAYLARPERIEALARAQGLQPIREPQFSRLDEPEEDAIARLIERTGAAPGSDPGSPAP